MKRAAIVMAAAVALLGATPAPDDRYEIDPHAGVWLHGPNLPSPRQDTAIAVLGARIYVIGGLGPGAAPTDTTFVLEPASGTNLAPSPEQPPAPTLPVGSWSTARPIPEVIDHAAAASLDGYVYVAGGTVEKLVTNKFWRYDPSDDSWAVLPPLPVPRYGPSMQASNGKLYLMGGTSSHGHDERSIEVYDPATASWSLIQDALPVEREGSATSMFGGRIALVGGRDREERNQASCDLFDPANNAWSICSSLHLARSEFGLASIGDRLFAIGGVNLLSGLTTQTTEISGAGGQGWMDGHWMPAPRQGMSIAVIGHTVWVVGGSNWDATAPTASVLRYVIPLVRVKFGGRAPQ
jgi:Kelch motif protein